MPTLLAAGVIGVLVSRRQVKPLLRLTEGAKTIAAGNYDTRMVVTTHDEIGVLANTFNQMAAAMGDPCPYPQNLAEVRVLAVDDNATNRRILRSQLDRSKMKVETSANGEEVLKMMREAAFTEKPYSLALLDIQMPKMDGLTLARAIQEDRELAGTSLIVLTSFRQTLSPAELKAAGIEAYLVKPVKQARLLDCVARAMTAANGK